MSEPARKSTSGRHRVTRGGRQVSPFIPAGTYSRYVGRVGALAFALGIGVAVVTMPGVARADSHTDTAPSQTRDDKPPSDPADAPDRPDDADNDSQTTSVNGNDAPLTAEAERFAAAEESEGNDGRKADADALNAASTPPESQIPQTVTDPVVIPVAHAGLEPANPAGQPDQTPAPAGTPEPAAPPATRNPMPLVAATPLLFMNDAVQQAATPSQGNLLAFVAEDTILPSAPDPVPDAAGSHSFATAPGVETNTAAPPSYSNAVAEPTPQPEEQLNPIEVFLQVPGTFISNILNAFSAVFAPVIGPGAPAANPALWGLLEWVRRTFNKTWANSTPTLDPRQTSLDIDGDVHGTFGGSDPDSDTLTYSVPMTGQGAPTNGTVSIDQAHGTWTYTPNPGFTGEDSFTVAVTDTADGWHLHALGARHRATGTVQVTAGIATNAAPSVDSSDGTTGYTEQGSPVAVDTGLTVSDADSTNLTGATVSISGATLTETLAFTAGNGITGSYNDITGVLTLTGTTTVDNYRTALRSVTYANTSDTPAISRTINFAVTDGTTPSTAVTKTIAVTPVDDAPALASMSGSIGAAPDTPVAVDPTITITDADDTTLVGATVAITAGLQSGEDVLALTPNPQNGITASYNNTTGILTLTGTGTVADYQTALRAITYTNTDTTPTATARTLSITVNDGELSSNTVTHQITFTAPSGERPVLSTSSGNTAYVEQDPPVAIDDQITITDADSTHLTGATVSIAGATSTETLDFQTPENSAITGTDANGVLTLTGASTVAEYEAALRSVTYENTSDTPPGIRSVTVVVSDGTFTAQASKSVTITAINDRPQLTLSDGSTLFNPGSPVYIDSTLTLTDPDSATLLTAIVEIVTPRTGGETLAFTPPPGSNISGSYNPSFGGIQLLGNASVADYQAALQSLTYHSTSGTQPDTVRIRIQIQDSSFGASLSETKQLEATDANIAPTLSSTSGDSVAAPYIPVSVDPAITVSDPDNAFLTGATVTISGGLRSDQDVLALDTAPSGITASYDETTGELTLTGSGTAAAYQSALRSVTYTNTSDTPETAPRTISIAITDGITLSNNVTHLITPSQPPAVATSAGSTTYAEQQGPTVVDGDVTVDDDLMTIASAVISIESPNSTETLAFTAPAGSGITGSYDTVTGVLTLTGTSSSANYQTALRSVTYQNSSDTPPAARTVSFVVNDGAGTSGVADKSVTITGLNDAPRVVTSTGNTSFTPGSPAVVDGGLTLSDPDSAMVTAATVTLSTPNATEELSFTAGNGITGSYNAVSGVLTLTGSASVADYQSVLRTVTYTNSAASAAPRTVSFVVTDGAAPSTAATKSLYDNDAPVAGTPTLVVDASTGVVTGSVPFTDADLDPLSYRLADEMDPAIGTVTINASTGEFVFTPSPRTRYNASLTSGPDSVPFTVIASDGISDTATDIDAPVAALHPDDDGVLTAAELGTIAGWSGLSVRHDADGDVSIIDGRFTDDSVLDSASAAAALNRAAALFGANTGFATGAAITAVTVTQSNAAEGTLPETYYRFQHRIDGALVLGNDIVLVTDGNSKVTGVFSGFNDAIYGINGTPDASVDSAAEAVAIVISDFENEFSGFLDEATITATIANSRFDAKLVIEDLDPSAAPRLVWRVNVTPIAVDGSATGAFTFFSRPYVIAADGTSAGSVISGLGALGAIHTRDVDHADDLLAVLRTINVERIDNPPAVDYQLSDTVRRIKTYTIAVDEATSEATHLRVVLKTASGWDPAAVSAHANTAAAYDYYAGVLGDTVLQLEANQVRVIVLDTGQANALWDQLSRQIYYGGNMQTAVDIVGHEITHAIIETHIPDVPTNADGRALHEGYADILGGLVEGKPRTDPGRWLMGEDRVCASSSCAVRDMSNPTIAHMDGFNPNGDPHANGEIFSFAAYKMMTDPRTAAVADETWARVYYNSLQRLSAGATMLEARDAVVSAARSRGFDDAQMQAVTEAFSDVGLDAQG